jgi:hypothetical protein
MSNILNNLKINNIKTFITFLDVLDTDFLNNIERWGNKTLPDFLEALKAYTEDI